MKKWSKAWQSENRSFLKENQIDWSCKSLRRTECSECTRDYRKPFAYAPRPANKNETLITYDRFSSASKGPRHYFPPSTPAILPISYEDAIERVQPGLSRWSGGYQGGTFLTLSILNGELGRYISARRFDADDVADFIRSLVRNSSFQ